MWPDWVTSLLLNLTIWSLIGALVWALRVRSRQRRDEEAAIQLSLSSPPVRWVALSVLVVVLVVAGFSQESAVPAAEDLTPAQQMCIVAGNSLRECLR